MSKSILYYTGHCKDPIFEERIRQTMMDNNPGLPIVSVTQKPIDCGKNICVGNVGASYVNVFRQILIGAQAVETEWIVLTEDDYLYPPEFFQFDPPVGEWQYYRYSNTWIVGHHGNYRRGYSANAMVTRDFAIRTMTECLKGWPTEWADGGRRVETGAKEFMGEEAGRYGEGCPPIIGFKCGGNLSKIHTGIGMEAARSLEPWGDVYELKLKYNVIGCGGINY